MKPKLLPKVSYFFRLRLQRARAARGLNQAEVAELIGIDREAMRRLEKGLRKLTVMEFVALCIVYRIDTVELLQTFEKQHEVFEKLRKKCAETLS